eukprot:scaffold127901_cov18-Tisochrysis_lutea.AAC.2
MRGTAQARGGLSGANNGTKDALLPQLQRCSNLSAGSYCKHEWDVWFEADAVVAEDFSVELLDAMEGNEQRFQGAPPYPAAKNQAATAVLNA